MLPEAFHAVRSLVCLSTNETPHERFLRFPRKAMTGSALPSWLLHRRPVLLHRHVRNKGDPLCDPVDLVERKQTYSVIHLRDGQETNVSTSDLAPNPRCPVNTDEITSDVASNHPPQNSVENFSPACHDTSSTADETFPRSPDLHSPSPSTDSSPLPPHEDVQPLRRSTR